MHIFRIYKIYKKNKILVVSWIPVNSINTIKFKPFGLIQDVILENNRHNDKFQPL